MKKQYRVNHTLYKSERDPVNVMTFETYELENDDILEYLICKYLKGSQDLLEVGINLKDKKSECVDEYKKFFRESLDYIKSTTGKDIKYVVWLSDMDGINNYYSKWYHSDDVIAIDISDAIVLTDIGEYGKLYGFEEDPIGEPVETSF